MASDDGAAALFAARRLSNIPSLVCALMANLSSGGVNYAFAMYSEALKRNLDLSQGELDTISTTMFVAGVFGWIPGIIVDRYGPRFAMCLGGSMNAITLLLFWSIATKQLLQQMDQSFIVPTLSFLGFTSFLLNCLVIGSVFKIVVSCCTESTMGTVVGLSKGYVGLGAGTYSCIFRAIRRSNESDLDYLPMAAFFAFCTTAVPAFMLLPKRMATRTRTRQQQMTHDNLGIEFIDEITPLHFRLLYAFLLMMAVVILRDSLVQLLGTENEHTKNDGKRRDWWQDSTDDQKPNFGLAIVVVSLWLGPIVTWLFLPRKTNSHHHHDHHRDNQALDDSTLSMGMDPRGTVDIFGHINSKNESTCLLSSSYAACEEFVVSNNNAPPLSAGDEGGDADDDALDDDEYDENDMNLIQMLQTPSAWLLLWTTTIIVGSGAVQTTNMAQMVQSLGFPQRVTPVSVAVFSVSQAVTRVVTGALSDAALNSSAMTRGSMILGSKLGSAGGIIPRTVFFVVASSICFCAQLILTFATTSVMTFMLGVAFCAISFGMNWSLLVLVVGDVFGTKHVGANYMFYDGFTLAVGTLFLVKFLSQTVYENQIDDEDIDNDDPLSQATSNTCLGTGCFQLTHIVIAVLAASCIGTSLLLVHTPQQAYGNNHKCTKQQQQSR